MSLYRRRVVEIKHGRVCMMAFLGMTVGPNELFAPSHQLLSPSLGIHFDDIPGGIAAIPAVPAAGWFQIIAVVGIHELTVNKQDYTKEPGEIPTFLGFKPESVEEFREKQLKELKNGRLAMIAVLGELMAQQVSGQGTYEQLGSIVESLDIPLPPKYYHLRQLSALSGALEGEGNVERLDNGAELLVTELLDRLRLESQEGGDLSRLLGVVLLVDSELVDADHRNDLEPTSGRHRRDGSDAAGNVVKVDAERGREQLVRRREELVRSDGHAEEGHHADASVLDLDDTAAVKRLLVLSEAKGVPDLTLWRAAEDGVVDTADEVLHSHAHRRGARLGRDDHAVEGRGDREQRQGHFLGCVWERK